MKDKIKVKLKKDDKNWLFNKDGSRCVMKRKIREKIEELEYKKK